MTTEHSQRCNLGVMRPGSGATEAVLRTLALAMLLLVAVAPWSTADAQKAQVLDARSWEHSGYTRFVVEVTGQIDYTTFALANPYRLVVDLPEVDFVIPRRAAGEDRSKGMITGYRYGLFKAGTSRLVLDLTGPAEVTRSFLLPPGDGKPYRLVLDLERTSKDDFEAVAVRPPPKPRVPAVRPDTAQARVAAPVPRDSVRTIVIDPGHGGVDPGAIGVSGIREKDVALDVARDIAAKLRAKGGYRVILTRESDTFLRLRDRMETGRLHGAELFLSLHADSIGQRSVRGAHIYSLSEKASDAEAAALAAKENKADIIAGVDLAMFTVEVGTILLDLAQRETNNVSAGFAEKLVGELKRGNVMILRKPHRQAGFAVLKAPDVPSVLVELGFLSNQADEEMLTDPRRRAPLVDAIVLGVDRHFTTQTARNAVSGNSTE